MRIALFDPALMNLRSAARMAAIVLFTTSLAACASSSGASTKYAARHPSLIATAGAKQHLALLRPNHGTEKGVASFYTEGTETANGEKIDPNALTAAHRSLPFGTMLKVTDVTTGRSVTVRVNDRGPYVGGRVVDLSLSAAEALGIVDQGVTKVRLDVVR
jgi:rare lipoprotein A